MDLFTNLSTGFSIAVTPQNLLYCFIGVFYGTIIGVLPGIGPVVGISILLPLTFNMAPTSAIIMLAGIYYGGAYGGSTTSILVNTPGEGSSVVTCLDGHQMALQGRAKAALATSAIGSFFAGTVAAVLVMLIAGPLSLLGLMFTPAEYFSLLVLALVMVGSLATESPLKGVFTTLVGLFLAMVGIDQQTGQIRFAFGNVDLMEGIDFVVVAIGLFAIAEVLVQAEVIWETGPPERVSLTGAKWWTWLSWEELKQSFLPYCRGTLIGFIVGVLPGAGATTASFIVYIVEKKSSKHPEMFGKGAIEGVAAPEASNNAAHQGAMVPLLTLGIPGSAATAVILGAFMIYGVQPGPLLLQKNPEFVWAIIASMYIANGMLVILNLPLINIFVKLLDLPAALLYSMVLAFCTLGVYSLRFTVFDVFMAIFFGVIGYFMRKHNYPAAPLLLALVLGEMIEQGLRRALGFSNGDWSVFFTRPISLGFQILIVVSLLYSGFSYLRKRKKEMGGTKQESDTHVETAVDPGAGPDKDSRTMVKRRWENFVSFDSMVGILTIPLAIFLIVVAYRTPRPKVLQTLGPEFLPIAVLSLIILCAIVIFIDTAKITQKLPDAPTAEPSRAAYKRQVILVLIIAGLVFYGAILDTAGYIISTTFLLLWSARLFEKGKWVRNVIVSLLFSFSVYYSFVHLLGVMLPAGILAW